jgi:N-acetylmuramic acid 6-phosphate (MurNAc-6-P) etherase
MIRLGRAHQGLMVNVQVIIAKLLRRSEHVLRQTGCGRP